MGRTLVAGVIGLAVGLVGMGGFLLLSGDSGAEEVLLEPIGFAGPDPFSDPTAPEPAGSLQDFAENGAPGPPETTTTLVPTTTTLNADSPGGPTTTTPDDTGEPGRDGTTTTEEATTASSVSTTASTSTTTTTSSTTTTTAPTTTTTEPTDVERKGDYRAADGDEVGLYGGTLNAASCDVDQLVDFLTSNPDKGAAWAEVQGVSLQELPDYLSGLTPVNLGVDTRVINHGFANGKATPREAVLQRGTAVLVDGNGVPRVKCGCGNPLLPPEASTDESYDGDAWTAFEASEVTVVNESAAQIDALELVDVETGEQFSRPVGTSGEADVPSRPESTPVDFDASYSERLDDPDVPVTYTITAPGRSVVTLTMSNEATSAGAVQAQFTSPEIGGANITVAPGEEVSGEVTVEPEEGASFELVVAGGPASYQFRLTFEVIDPDAPASS